MKQTAWWVRRLGAAAGVIALGLIVSALDAREQHAAETPELAAKADAVPSARYGPDPNRRLSPQINRIIRLAQRTKLDEDKKNSGSQFKSAPVQKKTAPPVQKKQTTTPPRTKSAPVQKKKSAPPVTKKKAPVIKKRETAPVIKKKEKAPVLKKKEQAPVLKKEAPPVIKKDAPAKTPQPTEKAPPVEKAPPAEAPPPITPGGTPEQQKENEAVCVQNPNDPSCLKEEAPPEQPTPQEAYCEKNPTDPKCAPFEKAPQPTEKAPPADEKETQPSPGRPDQDSGGVGSICEQNPQLPQCQLERPDDTPPPQPGPGGTDAPPGFPPPGAPPVPPGPPGSPPPPPPSDSGDDTPPAPSGPTIQTVTECTAVQVTYEGACLDACPDGMLRHYNNCVTECPEPDFTQFNDMCVGRSRCPEGEVQQGWDDGEPVCQAACDDGWVSMNGNCVGTSYCGTVGGTRYNNAECVEQCPEGALTYNGRCYDQCPDGVYDLGDGTCGQCVEENIVGDQCRDVCPAGQFMQDGECVPGCPDDLVLVGDACVPSCGEGMIHVGGQCVPARCETPGDVRIDGVCISQGEIPYEDFIDQCLGNLERAPDQVPPDLAGETPRETCENLVDQLCDQLQGDDGDRASDVQACLERPCAEGQENVAGQCVALCAADQERGPDGQCIAVCPEGQERGPDGQCAPVPCTDEQVTLQDGSCAASCPDGQEAVNAQCVAVCPAGAERDANGLCPGECPEGERMGLNGQCQACAPRLELVNGQCVATCLGGGGRDENGECQTSCPEGQVITRTEGCFDRCTTQGWTLEYDGRCLQDCPEGQMLYQGQCQQMEMCPDGTYQRVGRHDVCVDECPAGQVAVNTTEGAQCRGQCDPRSEEVDGQCVASCPWGQTRGADGQCSNPCPGDQIPVRGGACRDPCPEGSILMVDVTGGACYSESNCPTQIGDMCVPGARSPDDAVELCMSGSYLGSGNRDQAACEEALAAYCAENAAPDHYGSIPPECIGSPDPTPPPAEEVPPSGEETTPPGEDTSPPSEEGTPPAEDDATAPGDESPVEEEPAEEQQPPPEPCPDGQVRLGGTCTAAEEVPYDDFIDECVASGDLNVPGTGGMTPQQACEALVDSACTGGSTNFPTDSQICTERPCDEGLENVGGVCQAPGAEDTTPPPSDEAPPAEETEPPEDEAPPPAEDHTPPPPDETTPPPPTDETPPQDEAPPPAEETPPPGDGDYGSICEQNPQFPQCQDQDADEGTPPPGDEQQPPPVDEAPPPDVPGPPPSVPPADSAPPPSAPPAGPPPAAPPAAEPAPSTDKTEQGASDKPIAVVIALDGYDDEALKGSSQAISNAAHIVRFLKEDLGLDGTRIVTGRNATKANFEEIFGKVGDTEGELQVLVEKTKSPEVIVYYAGLAKAIDGGSDMVLLPSDADPAKPETGVRLSALYGNLYNMGIPKLRVYLDPTFVDGDDVLEVDAGARIGIFGLFTPKDWITLSGAKDTSKLGETKKTRSLFTESLVSGLEGMADTTGEGDKDGTVSAQELYDFVRIQAEAAAKRGETVPPPSLYGKPDEALRAY